MKKILITRTDRIGDVLLSTPVFRTVREAYPESHIAVIVRPYAKDIVEGNPYIDEVIIYDKYGIHKSILGMLKFSLGLMMKRFDLAMILHPTKRMHIITMLAGIPKRIGFNWKGGFLLTDRIPHTKQLGEKHEVDYTLDVARAIGIKPLHRSLYFPIKREIDEKVKNSLRDMGVTTVDRLIAIHPAASCPSKRWPQAYFAKLADELVVRFAARIAVISDSDSSKYASLMMSKMRHRPLDFSGKTSVSELGSLIRQCGLLISNDSGPVHIAVAVGTPVIAIFGRKDRGLGPVRWGPLGEKDIIFHKDTGCTQCLAHNCKNGFRCLSAISVDEVLGAVGKILNIIELQKPLSL